MNIRDSKWRFLLKNWLEIVTGILLLYMVVLVAIGVILRYIFGTGIVWSFESVSFAYVWLIFLGSVIAIKRNAHIGLNIIVERLPKKIRIFTLLMGDLLVMFFLVVLTFYGYRLVNETANHFVSPVMKMPMEYVYLIFPASGILMFFEMVRVLRGHLRGEK